MAYYLVYTRCPDCIDGSCFQCTLPGRQLVLSAVQADQPPDYALTGPCETPQELLLTLHEYFEYDEVSGQIRFKDL